MRSVIPVVIAASSRAGLLITSPGDRTHILSFSQLILSVEHGEINQQRAVWQKVTSDLRGYSINSSSLKELHLQNLHFKTESANFKLKR